MFVGTDVRVLVGRFVGRQVGSVKIQGIIFIKGMVVKLKVGLLEGLASSNEGTKVNKMLGELGTGEYVGFTIG